MAAIFDPPRDRPLPLPAHETWPKAAHVFDARSVWAVRAAIASGRPLLLRGEPGIGKSQIARAVAVEAGVPFLYHVVHERSERDELLFSYDAVARLAAAQVSALVKREEGDWVGKLAEANFVRPGVLWWAFDWLGASVQADRFSLHCRECLRPAKIGAGGQAWEPTDEGRPCGPVVLIDEIDKADPSVPNGLLECLGNQGFRSEQTGAVALPEGAKAPLIVLTTNEERELPPAFLRRCLVHELRFPGADESHRVLVDERVRALWGPEKVSDEVCAAVLRQLLDERDTARRFELPLPGAAEMLDLVRVLVELAPGDSAKQLEALTEIADFALRKNPAALG